MGTGGNQVPVIHCLNDQGGRVMDVSEEKTGTLRAEAHGHAPIIHSYCIAGNTIDRQPQNGGNGTGNQEELSYTLNTMDRHAVAVGYRQSSFGQYEQDGRAGTQKASGGDLGGAVKPSYMKTVGSLCARDYKGVGSQYVEEGKVIVDER
jgi:DNA (cytosine-5)-methyltransferase 1